VGAHVMRVSVSSVLGPTQSDRMLPKSHGSELAFEERKSGGAALGMIFCLASRLVDSIQ
jgi:hypothetical protein